MNVTDAVLARHSTRAFTSDPVPAQLVRTLLDTAKRAPSGGNLQPWRVFAMTGQPLAHFKALIAAKLKAGIAGEPPEYAIYPPGLWEPLRGRRREAGALRYAALGLSRGVESQEALNARNFQFFGAPVGLFFCLDRRVGPPQWSDVGMYMQTLMLLAVEQGLATCPQEVWANWPRSIAEFLQLPDELMLFAGMSMGYADKSAPINQFRTEREAFDNFAQMLGF